MPIPIGTAVAKHTDGFGAPPPIRDGTNEDFCLVTFSSSKLSLLIAHADETGWPADLSDCLDRWPIGVHWSHSDMEAIGIATSNPVHLFIVDDQLPPSGGLDAIRRIRRMGLTVPCLYVCDDPAPRLLSDAIKLDVFSVIDGEPHHNEIPTMISRIARRVYDIELPKLPNEN